MANPIREQIDLLCRLRLPDRFEPLLKQVGANLSKILVAPAPELSANLQSMIDHVRAAGQGAFVPLSGPSGAGKTTFARETTQWFARDIAPTVDYENAITYDGLKQAVDAAVRTLPNNNSRIIPINIDHRESNPPTDIELSEIKRFLRTSPSGCTNIMFWPETDPELARQVGERYAQRAGSQPINFFKIEGPPRETWQETAIATLRLSNGMDDLEGIGVDPKTYDTAEFPSIGEFLRRIHQDFNKILRELRAQINKAVVLLIVFISESDEPGVLNFLTSSGRHARLDASGLLQSTPESEVGRWWADRRGLLVRTIVQLNAYGLFLPPAATISALCNLSESSDPVLSNLGVTRLGPAKAVSDLGRTDVSKILRGNELARFEGRGNPARGSVEAFKALVSNGLNLGKDKRFNGLLTEGWKKVLAGAEPAPMTVNAEKALDFCSSLIPDTSVIYSDTVICIEYAWRKGEFLTSGNRSNVAQYVLTKLRNYAREFGWAENG